jgi:hypothetical protein
MTAEQEVEIEIDTEVSEDYEETAELVQPLLKEFINAKFDKHGWSSRQFLNRGIPHTSMRAVRNPHKRVGEKLLTKVAEVFNLPLQTVMEWGEVVPSASEMEQRRRHLIHIYENVADEQKQMILDFALFISEKYPSHPSPQPLEPIADQPSP